MRAFLETEQARLLAEPRSQTERNPLAGLFDYQRAVLESPGAFKALLWGRRRGKTDLGRRWLADGLLNDAPGTESLFFALTAESARGIFWRPLRALDEELSLGLKFDESKWTVTGPRRQTLTVTGAETVATINRKRGFGFKRIWGSEIGAFRDSVMQVILQDVLEATMMDDAASMMILESTPGISKAGLWWEITSGQLDGWTTFFGTARDNPVIQARPGGFEAFIEDVLKRWKWTRDTPKFKREYLGEWATDPSLLAYRFERERNVVADLPQLNHRDRWRTVMAVDFGVVHPTAYVVLREPERYGTAAYVVASDQKSGMGTTEAADWLRGPIEQWKPDVLVGDIDNLGGKLYAMELASRHGIHLRPAQKAESRVALEIASDMLAGGELLLLDSATTDLQRQLATLLRDEKDGDVADGQADDLADALKYAARETLCYANRVKPPPEYVAPKHVLDPDELDPDDLPQERHYLEVDDVA